MKTLALLLLAAQAAEADERCATWRSTTRAGSDTSTS